MATLSQDLRFSFRSLRKNPGFFTVAVFTLALGIGVNTAIFSLVYPIFFSKLPIEDPERVAFVRATRPQLSEDRLRLSIPDFLDLRERSRSFDSLAAMDVTSHILTGGDEVLRLNGSLATSNLFDVWGVSVIRGRGFLPGEDQPGAAKVALLSHGFWDRHFGSDPAVVGDTLHLDGEKHTVIGVLAPEIEFGTLATTEVWTPLLLDRDADRDAATLLVTGLLANDTTVEQASEELAAIGRQLADEHPETHTGRGLRAEATRDALFDDSGRVLIVLMLLTVGMVLLIACANVANLMLARSGARGKEIAVRTALGAGRLKLLRQLMMEGALIALAAAAAGLGLAWGLTRWLIAIVGDSEPVFRLMRIDGNVLVFTLIIALATPLAFALVPALRASRPDLQGALRDAGERGNSGPRGWRSRAVLVVAQVAMALVLMLVAGLLIRTIINLQRHPTGFDAADLLTLRIELPQNKYGDDDRVLRFFEQVLEGAEALPGAGEAALVSHRPTLGAEPRLPFVIEGRPEPEEAETQRAYRFTVTPGFHSLMKIPLLRGRALSTTDTAEAVPVALVSETAAALYWPGEDAVGQRIRLGRDANGPWRLVVGVVGDVQGPDPTEPDVSQIYVPHTQDAQLAMALMVHGRGSEPTALVAPIRRLVQGLDAEQPIGDVRTMEQILADNSATGFAFITLFSVFAGFALLMAAMGIYGVMAYAVSRRLREIGIRMALGARTHDVGAMVLRQGALLLAIGSVLGLGGGLLISRFMAGLLFEINPVDPVVFVSVPLVLAAVGLLANAVPAWRAARVDPVRSLRIE